MPSALRWARLLSLLLGLVALGGANGGSVVRREARPGQEAVAVDALGASTAFGPDDAAPSEDVEDQLAVQPPEPDLDLELVRPDGSLTPLSKPAAESNFVSLAGGDQSTAWGTNSASDSDDWLGIASGPASVVEVSADEDDEGAKHHHHHKHGKHHKHGEHHKGRGGSGGDALLATANGPRSMIELRTDEGDEGDKDGEGVRRHGHHKHGKHHKGGTVHHRHQHGNGQHKDAVVAQAQKHIDKDEKARRKAKEEEAKQEEAKKLHNKNIDKKIEVQKAKEKAAKEKEKKDEDKEKQKQKDEARKLKEKEKKDEAKFEKQMKKVKEADEEVNNAEAKEKATEATIRDQQKDFDRVN